MATLEKIRSKSVFLLVVIAVALLAFILGDALTNGRNLFGDQTVVAKAGNEKIDIQDYQRKREELNTRLEQYRRQNPQAAASIDPQMLSQMAIDQLINEKLLDAAVKKLGLTTTGEQLRFYMIENPANPNISTLIQQMNAAGISVQTPAQAHEIIFNPKRNGLTDEQVAPYQRMWLALEAETRDIVARQTYQRLLYGTVQANELDKKALYNDYIATSSVEVAYKPFGQLDEKTYPVSDSEVRAEYDKIKNRFKVEAPTKAVSFVAVNIAPSDADRAAAKQLAAQTVAQLNSVGQLSKDARKEGVSSERHQLRAADLPAGAVKDFVTSGPLDTVRLVSEDFQGFTAVKVLSRTQESDSIQLNLVQVVGKTLPARVLASLNAGLPIDSVTARFTADSVMVQADQWFPMYNADGATNALEKAQLDSLSNAGGRYITIFDSEQGAVLARLNKKTAPVTIYEFDEINYALKPSTATVSSELSKLEKFLADNNTAEKFNANAAKAGYTVQNYELTQASAGIERMPGMGQYLPDSRQVVRWVMMDAKPGQVSHVYESKDAMRPALYAVAVDAAYDDFVPVNDKNVKRFVTDRVRRAKAGEAMAKEYAGVKTVDEAAAKMGSTKRNSTDFRFAPNGQVRDQKVTGRVAGTKPSNKVTVAAGDDGVYVFRVAGNSKQNFPYNETQYEQQYMQMVNPQLDKMLRGNKKIVNNAYKFEAGE